MAGTTDEVKIRELPEKTTIDFSDKFIVEDNDGTKQVAASALRSLMQKCIFYDNIEAMKSASLQEGDVVQTLGYHEPHDGGGALYQILYKPTDLEDGMLIHYLHTSDTLRAHLVKPTAMNVLWAGAKGDGITDDYTAIRKALDSGLPVYFPNRTYKIRTALEINTNTKDIDFNGCTLKCESSACLSLVDVHNFTINNVVLAGKQGISIAGSCDRIRLVDCTICAPSADIKQQYGVLINGAKNITILNTEIGDYPYVAPTVYGVSIGIGTVNGSTVSPERITIDNCYIQAEYHGIESNSTTTTKGLSISKCQLCGVSTGSRDDIEAIGVWIGANDKSINISDCGFVALLYGVQITSLVSPVVHATNNAFYDTRYAYSVLSNKAILALDGSQSFYGSEISGVDDYIFDRMGGTLNINTCNIVKNGTKLKNAANTITGSVYDSNEGLDIYIANSTITKIELTDSLFNTAVYVPDGSIISSITGAIAGQKAKIMAKPGLTSVRSKVVAGDIIKLGGGKEEAILPITLRYTGSYWIEV